MISPLEELVRHFAYRKRVQEIKEFRASMDELNNTVFDVSEGLNPKEREQLQRLLADKSFGQPVIPVCPVAQLKIGQIWATTSPDFRRIPMGFELKIMIITCTEERMIMGVPISEYWELAGERDLVVFPGQGFPKPCENSNCGIPRDLNGISMIETWAESPIVPGAFCEYIGEISTELQIKIFAYQSWAEEPDSELCEKKFVETKKINGVFLDTWTVTLHEYNKTVTIVTGHPFHPRFNPRREFRQMEMADLAYLFEAHRLRNLEMCL